MYVYPYYVAMFSDIRVCITLQSLPSLHVEIPEPVYKIEKPPTAHQIKQDALRKKHSNFYRYMLL